MLQSLISRLSVLLASTILLTIVTPVARASSALYVESPSDLVDKIERIDGHREGELIGATAAYFGSSFYQSLMSGNVVVASEGKMEDGTNATYGCGGTTAVGFNVTSNPRWRFLSEQSFGRPSVVLMVQRGALDHTSCPFDRKVFNAQQTDGGGVVGVLVYDPTEPNIVRMIDRSLGPQIRIPSFFLNNRYNDPGSAVPRNVIEKFVADQRVEDADLTEMSLEFYLPNPDGRVELEYWYNVADDVAVPFLTTFGAAARPLAGKMLIQPKQYFFEKSSCKDVSNCDTTCWTTGIGNSKRYWCSPTTSPPSKFGNVAGKSIVREAVRQICLYNALLWDGDVGEQNVDNVWMWRYWEFFYRFDGEGVEQLRPSDWVDETDVRVKKIFQWMQMIGMPSSFSYDKVKQCVDGVAQGNNIELLTNMTRDWDEMGPNKHLSIYINDNEYYGTPRCPIPITQGTCAILSGICYGYANGTEPEACLQDQNCPFGQPNCGGGTIVDNSVVGVTPGAVVGIVIAFLIVVGVVVWLYLRYYKQRMRADVDVLLQQYLPMDPGATHGVQSRSRVREAQEKRLISDIDLEDQALETRGL